jgi:recombination protein RecA
VAKKSRKSARRTPVKKSGSKRTKIRKDPLKEYAEAISKDGVVEALTLADDDCLASVRGGISTGSLALDRLLNGTGIPFGRVTEICGAPHIGKSTLLDHVFARVQAEDGVAILADTEGARDSSYTTRIGVDPERLQYLEFQPRPIREKNKIVGYQAQLTLENVLTKILESIEFWAKKYPETPVVIGFDALAGTSTADELENRLTKDEQPAAAAKVLRKICRQLPVHLGNTKIAVVICNHEYQNIRMAGRVGKARETYGGDAIRHLASIRMQMFSAGEWLKDADGRVLGRVVGVKLTKNRLGNPWGEARIALYSGIGIDNVWTIYRELSAANIIVTSGSWSAINLDGSEIKFQGYRGLSRKCEEDPTLFPRLVSVYQGLP